MSSIVVRTHLRNLEGGMRRGFWDSIMSCFLFWVLLLCTHVYFVDLGTSLSILYFFSFFFFFKFVYLLFMAVLGLHLRARASPSCGKWGPLLIAVRGPLTIAASLVAEHRLQTHRLSKCGSRALSLRGMWDPPRTGLKPVSPASAGRLPTTAPPGKPSILYLNT